MSSSPLVIYLQGPEWDISVKDKLEDALAPALDHPDVVLDLSAVTFMDSTCLGKLVHMYKERVNKHGFRPARLVIKSPNIQRLFRMVEFDKLWPMFGTLEEALAPD